MERLSQNEKVLSYVTATANDYQVMWYSQKDLAIHFGYYDCSTKTHSDSLVKMNEVISNKANVTDKDYVLDAGCGIGGTGIWLAKHRQSKVMGIDLATYRLQKAILYAVDNEVSHLLDFRKADYTQTPFGDQTFSVVWGHEAICHSDCKQQFIHEAYRVLNEQGRLVIAEYMLRKDPQLTVKEQYRLGRWLSGWAMHDLLTLEQYKQLIINAGFKHIEVHDITDNTIPSLRRLARFTYPIISGIDLFFKLKLDKWIKERHRLILKNIQASYDQYKLVKSNTWKYIIVIAYKSPKVC